MFTFLTLWFRPYWDNVEYHATLRYEQGDGTPPVHLSREGTIGVPGDSTPEQMLLFLAKLLVQQQEMQGGQGNLSPR